MTDELVGAVAEDSAHVHFNVGEKGLTPLALCWGGTNPYPGQEMHFKCSRDTDAVTCIWCIEALAQQVQDQLSSAHRTCTVCHGSGVFALSSTRSTACKWCHGTGRINHIGTRR